MFYCCAKMRINELLGVLFCEIILIVDFTSGKYPIEILKEKQIRTVDIEAVEGRTVSLPCPLSTPIHDVYMILWFRDNAGIPLYSFDVRSKSTTEARHWSAPEVFGSRAKFNIESTPASLDIKDIKRHDQGVYRCRIDFRASQTQSFRYNLSVIILPEQPIVLDQWGRQLNGTMLGPKLEGDNVMITCRVVGGRPQPVVRWLVNGVLFDDEYEHNSGDVIENRLHWPSIQRADLNSMFTCQTTNTLLVEPKESSYVLDMQLKPLTVNIINPPSLLAAERRYEVSCESTGSRPNAIITWYKMKRQLKRAKEEVSNNTTRSELSFVPTTEDDGKSITCRAENPSANGLFLETSWKLDVVYPPMVTLRLGSTLSPDDIKEGDDVYFECHVQANPVWRKLLWLHDGVHLAHNTSARVIRSNQSLVLQKVTRFSAGNYACSAINVEGETVSNQLPLRVKYSPICLTDKLTIIGASKDESVDVTCGIHADPPARTFRWKFNNSGETLDVGSERYTINGTHSILRYTPVTDQDYGTLSCWAINEVGTQNTPCVFQVVMADLPSSVSNCSLYNQTQMSVEIQCMAGYDGGLPQVFILELISTKTGITRYNFTNTDDPLFILDALDVLTSMMTIENNTLKAFVYAVNQKGRSPGIAISGLSIGESIKATEHNDLTLQLSPILIGAVLTIIISCCFIALRLCLINFLRNLRHNNQNDGKTPQQSTDYLFDGKCDTGKKNSNQKPRWQHIDIKTKPSAETIEDERDPDVIPSQYASDHYAQIQWSQNLNTTKTSLYNSNSHRSLIHSTIETRGPSSNAGTPLVASSSTISCGTTLPQLLSPSQQQQQQQQQQSPSSPHQHQPIGINQVITAITVASNLTSNHTTVTTTNQNNNTRSIGEPDLDINIHAIRDRLMTTRVPESCV